MENYRKSDEYYYDHYDRQTIADLKEREQLMLAAEKTYKQAEDPDWQSLCAKYGGLFRSYINSGVYWAREREPSVRNLINADERKDVMVKKAGKPFGVKCASCQADMHLELTDFIGEGYRLLFIFSCPAHHAPRRAFYANEKEYFEPERRCSYCNGKLKFHKKNLKKKIVLTHTCIACGKVETMELQGSKLAILPIAEEDRKKYCLDFVKRRAFDEDLELISSLACDLDRILETPPTESIRQINIAALEMLLHGEIEKNYFIKLAFDKPEIGRGLTMGFSLQDRSEREAEKSIKLLKKLFGTVLMSTTGG